MNPENWQKVEELLNAALEIEPNKRQKFLARIGAEDLRREVESLLEGELEAEKFLASPVVAFSANFFDGEDEPDTLIGQKIGNYKIVGELGRGGMGAVYLGERIDGKFSQRVALKLLKRELNTADIRRRFAHERQILAALTHPNIARLLDAGTTGDGLPYLVMEYVEGLPINEFCASENLDLNERLELFRTVCETVAFAHRNLIVHRDLKPSNILINRDGIPKLLDFGISKLLTPEYEAESENTVTKLGAMTPEYASPEQLRGESVTTATDVYSLGVILYELLTAHRPFEVKKHSVEEIIRAVCETEPTAPSAAWRDAETQRRGDTEKNHRVSTNNVVLPTRRVSASQLKGDLDNIVLKALKKEPNRRYSSVEQFSEDIRRHLSNLPVAARPDTLRYRATKFINRNRIAVFAAVLIFFTLIGGVVATVWQARRAEANQARAEKRFADVRGLSNALLNDIAPKIERLVGSTEARQSVVNQSLKYLDSLAGESTDDSALQVELAAAYEKVAELQGNPSKPNLGDFAGAILSYQKANRIRRSLPETRENQLLLAENFSGLANVRNAQNDVEGTLQYYAEALKIQENLLTKEPEADDLQTAYLKTKFAVAEVYSWNNKYDESVPRFREIIHALERLDTNKQETWLFLAMAYARLGNSLSWDNKQTEGENEIKKAVAIADRLAAENLNDTDIRHDVLNVYALASDTYNTVDDELSLQFALKALRLAEQSVERDPADIRAKLHLSEMYSTVGNRLTRLKRLPEAVANFEKVEKISFDLLGREPANRAYQRHLGIFYTRFGYVKEKQGDTQGALRDFQKAAEYYETIIQGEEKNLLDRRDMAQVLQSIGKVYLKLGEKPKAKGNFQKALDILNELKAQNALGEWDNKMMGELREALQSL